MSLNMQIRLARMLLTSLSNAKKRPGTVPAPHAVRLVDAEGKLSESVTLWKDALRLIDPHTQELRIVNGNANPPIAKILTASSPKASISASERRQMKRAARHTIEDKQYQLTWLVDAHDLAHKVQAMKRFLTVGRGNRIRLTVQPAQGTKDATSADHKKHKLAEVRRSMLDTEISLEGHPAHIAEWQRERWRNKAAVTLHFQAKTISSE